MPNKEQPPGDTAGQRLAEVSLLAALDDRGSHDTDSLKKLGGIFYKIGNEEWCDTSTASWRKEHENYWMRCG